MKPNSLIFFSLLALASALPTLLTAQCKRRTYIQVQNGTKDTVLLRCSYIPDGGIDETSIAFMEATELVPHASAEVELSQKLPRRCRLFVWGESINGGSTKRAVCLKKRRKFQCGAYLENQGSGSMAAAMSLSDFIEHFNIMIKEAQGTKMKLLSNPSPEMSFYANYLGGLKLIAIKKADNSLVDSLVISPQELGLPLSDRLRFTPVQYKKTY